MKPDGPPMPGDLDPVLERVYRRGYQLRSRRKLSRTMSAAFMILFIASASVFGFVKLTRRATSHDAPVLIAPATGPSMESPVSKATSSRSPAVPSPSPTPSHSATGCRNSFDPKCGTFYWIQDPGRNAPLRITISYAPANPTVGDRVTAIVTVSDDDAPIFDGVAYWGDGPNIGLALCVRPGSGGWIPAKRRSGNRTYTFTHTYSKPGSYVVRAYGQSSSSGGRCEGPDNTYGSTRDTSARITVAPNATSSPSPSPTPTAT